MRDRGIKLNWLEDTRDFNNSRPLTQVLYRPA